jgi:GGDEF domain-containing protein
MGEKALASILETLLTLSVHMFHQGDLATFAELLEERLSAWRLETTHNNKIRFHRNFMRWTASVLVVPFSLNGEELIARYTLENVFRKDSVTIHETTKGRLRGQILTAEAFKNDTIFRSSNRKKVQVALLEDLKDLAKLRKGEHVYVAKGDVDFLNKINRIYGKGIANVVLLEMKQALQETLDDLQQEYRLSREVSMVFGGDEISLSFPPSRLNPHQVEIFLNRLRESAAQAVRQRYGVAQFKGIQKSLDRFSPEEQKNILERLQKECGVTVNLRSTVDPETGEINNLALFPLGPGKNPLVSLETVTVFLNAILNPGVGQADSVKGHLNWLPIEGVAPTFRNGYLWYPTVSFGAVDIWDVLKEKTPNQPPTWPTREDERILLIADAFHRAEDALREAKKLRNTVKVGLYEKHGHTHAVPVGGQAPSPIPSVKVATRDQDPLDHRFLTETAFRRTTYRTAEEGRNVCLIQIGAVYTGPVIEEKIRGLSAKERMEEYRGGLEWVGLRGLNEIHGYTVGDQTIHGLLDAVAENLPTNWKMKAMSRFSDTIQIALEIETRSAPTDQEVGKFLDKVKETFQKKRKEEPNGVTIAQITATVVQTKESPSPGIAFEKLEATSALLSVPDEFFTKEGNRVRRYDKTLEPQIESWHEERALQAVRDLSQWEKKKNQETVDKLTELMRDIPSGLVDLDPRPLVPERLGEKIPRNTNLTLFYKAIGIAYRFFGFLTDIETKPHRFINLQDYFPKENTLLKPHLELLLSVTAEKVKNGTFQADRLVIATGAKGEELKRQEAALLDRFPTLAGALFVATSVKNERLKLLPVVEALQNNPENSLEVIAFDEPSLTLDLEGLPEDFPISYRIFTIAEVIRKALKILSYLQTNA